MIILKKALDFLSSKPLLFWLFGLWTAYYIVLSIWDQESFAHFVMNLQNKTLYQIPFVLFLVCGYLRIAGEAALFIRRGALLMIGRLMLPLGIMLFLTGFFISITGRSFEWLMVAEGHTIKPAWSGQELTVRWIKTGIGEDIANRSDKNLVFAHEPKVTVADSQMKLYDIGAFPPAKIGNTYMHILNFGLAPGIIISQTGDNKDEGYFPLRIISPGSSDTFNLPGHPYKIQVELIETIDMTKPLYGIKVYKDERVVKELQTRDLFEIDGITVEFKQPIFWVMMEAVRDYGVQFVIYGVLLVVIGGPLFLVLIGRRIISEKFTDSKEL